MTEKQSNGTRGTSVGRKVRPILLIAMMAVFLCCASAVAFAASFHITTTGGMAVKNVATVDNDYISHLVSMQNSDFDPSQTQVSGGTGWTSGYWKDSTGSDVPVMWKQTTGNTSESLKVLYPNLLKAGNSCYDVQLEITSLATDAPNACFMVAKSSPALELGQVPTGRTIPRSDQVGSKEIGYTIRIFEAGTTTPAKIKNIHAGVIDIDGNDLNVEGTTISGFTANSSNTFTTTTAQNRAMYANGSFYGTDTSNDDVSVWLKIGSLGNSGTYSAYYGWYRKVTDVQASGASRLLFYATRYNVTYTTDGNGSTAPGSEKRYVDENPQGSVQTPNAGYCFDHWTVDKTVTLSSGETVPAGPITEDQIKSVLVKEDLTFTAHYVPYVKVTYEWNGDHPDKTVPEGKDDIKKGETYAMDTSYKPGDTVYEENPSANGKTYPRGTWIFEGWDQNGTLTINEDTVIKGTWILQPEYNIDTQVVNGTISDPMVNIPEGENRTVIYSPKEGYQLQSVSIDGQDVDIHDFEASFAFNEIDADHSIKVIYEKIPALAITKTADKKIYNAGDEILYTVTVRQTEEGAEARGITIEDVLPNGLVLDTESFEGDVNVVSAEERSYTLSIESLRDELTYTYKALTDEDIDEDILTNIVKVKADNVPGDPAQAEETVGSHTPKPYISKTVSDTAPANGEDVIYTITVKEPQDGIVIRNAKVKDALPEGLEYVEGSLEIGGNEATANVNGRAITVTIPILDTETTFSFRTKVTKTEGQIVNTAEITGSKIEMLRDDVALDVKPPVPKLVKNADKPNACIGDTVLYTLTASTDLPLRNGTLTDTPPEGIEIIPESIECSDETWTASLSDNILKISFEEMTEPVTVTYKAKATKEGTLINTALLSAENYPQSPLAAKAEVNVKAPIPVINKEVNKKLLRHGEKASYVIAAHAKEGSLYDAVITDEIPMGLKLDKGSVRVSGEEAEVSISGNTITVNAPVIAQDKLFISYDVTAVAEGEHDNIASLTCANLSRELKSDAAVKVAAVKKASKETTKKNAKGKSERSVSSAPKTGDNSGVFIAAAIALAVLAAGMIIILVRRRKAQKK